MELAETRALFDECIKDAREETKLGGDPAKGLVHATCALAIATHLNEAPQITLDGRIDVDLNT